MCARTHLVLVAKHLVKHLAIAVGETTTRLPLADSRVPPVMAVARWVTCKKCAEVQKKNSSSDGVRIALNQIVAVVNRSHPIIVEEELGGHPLSMELDTGAAVSLISTKTDQALFTDEPVRMNCLSFNVFWPAD